MNNFTKKILAICLIWICVTSIMVFNKVEDVFFIIPTLLLFNYFMWPDRDG